MSGSPRTSWGAVALAVAGGLLLAGGTSADWVRDETVREVGGVALPEPTSVAGVAVAGELVGLGVALVLIGLALLAARGVARRALGVLLALAGAGGLVAVALAARRAAALPGTLASGPAFAALGAAAVLAAGVLAMRRDGRGPALPARYTVDEGEAEAGEWERASVETDEA